MAVLYNKIKHLRREKGVSQQELADYLNIERTSLSKIENMHYNPSARTMSAIATYFDLPIGEIFFNDVVSTEDTKAKTDDKTETERKII